MRFGIIIQDLEADEAANIINNLSGEGVQAMLVKDADGVVAGGNSAEFDISGMPWDERIHSGAKSQNKDGSWKKRKGVDESIVAQVEFELRGRAAAPAAAAPAVPVTPSVTPMAQKLDRLEAVVGIQPQNQFAPAPAAPVAPMAAAPAPIAPVTAPAPAAIIRDFAGLNQQLALLFRNNTVGVDYPNSIVNRINTGYGLQNNPISDLMAIANNPGYVAYAWQILDVDATAEGYTLAA